SQDTASRDIEGLIRTNVLVMEPGRGRSTSYQLVITPNDVLRVIADYVRAYSDMSVTTGSAMLRPEEAEARQNEIDALASEIESLADMPPRDLRLAGFNAILEKLHKCGFSPDAHLISTLAFVQKVEG
ncbi:MAG: hypothetical protein WCD42_05450, partial [Rhizomicrobium sp.]